MDANHDGPYLSHVCEKANHRVALFKEPLQYTRCVETARVGKADLSRGCHDCRILLFAGASGLPGKEKEARQAADESATPQRAKVFSRVKSHGTTQHGW
jgi:predicted  nucleic acid-binding Zn-ribbon protein